MPYRIAHLADSHLDVSNRLADNVACHDAFLLEAKAFNADLIVHAGDLFERASTPAERNALCDFLRRAADIAPVVGVKGNHDADGDLAIFNALDTTHTVRFMDYPTVAPGSALIVSKARGGFAAVLALPWFDKAHLAASLPADTPHDQIAAGIIDGTRVMLAALRAEATRCKAQGLPVVLVAHVQVAGSRLSTGQTLVGQTVELAPGELQDVGADYVALGHIHRSQGWGRVWYAGSTQRNNFGEPESKGCILATIEDEGPLSTQFRELPARKVMLHEMDFTAPGVDIGALMAGDWKVALVEGALVRLRYKIRPEDLHLVDEAKITAAFRAAGAYEVVCEKQLLHQERARCPEVIAAATVYDKLCAFWNAKGIDVPDVQHDRLRAKLATIGAR